MPMRISLARQEKIRAQGMRKWKEWEQPPAV